MFNLSGSEIVVILLLALIVLGPDKLPEAMRKAGKTWAELRKLSSGFQEEVRKGFEEPTTEVRQTANAIKKAATLPKNPVKGAVKSLLDPPKPYTETTATETTATETTAAESAAGETPAAETPAADDASAAEEAPAAETAATETPTDDTPDADATTADAPPAAGVDTVDIDVALADGVAPATELRADATQ